MPEMPHAGEHHRDAVLVGGGDDFGSRIEPPGWMTAVMPASAAWSRPSRNGKKASEAITAPRTARPASLGLDGGDARAVDAAHLAGADADGRRPCSRRWRWI
jgi:hypothetical protein